MKLKNFDELAVNGSRRAALAIAEAGLLAIDTKTVIRRSVALEPGALIVAGDRYALSPGSRVVVAGVGKCSLDAAAALEDILGDRISRGAVIDVRTGAPLKIIRAMQGTHPLPTEENVKAALAIVDILKGLTEKDLVIFVISGGGSTLLCLPDDMGCEDEANIFQSLTRAGATIQEINTVRKHLSTARGGYLAKYAYPARVASLIFSDVPGNDIQFIASGPTVKDTTTMSGASEVLAKYDVLRVCNMERCGLVETPKDSKYFAKVKNSLVVSNVTALTTMQKKAEELGFAARIVDDRMSGEARDEGVAIVRELHRAAARSVHLYGGETTVAVRGRGHGGRNLELALGAMGEIGENELVMSLASDGHDNGPFAGAIADRTTVDKAAGLRLDAGVYLKENNAYPFFEKAGNYLMTGETGSNVSDLIIALKT